MRNRKGGFGECPDRTLTPIINLMKDWGEEYKTKHRSSESCMEPSKPGL
ncbi:UNVERIFIED_CONTAM: hypothetical protein ABIC26_003418 [Paenibacillus sp. PvR008]